MREEINNPPPNAEQPIESEDERINSSRLHASFNRLMIAWPITMLSYQINGSKKNPNKLIHNIVPTEN